MKNRRFVFTAGVGCLLLLFLATVGLTVLLAPVHLMQLAGLETDVSDNPTLSQTPAIQLAQTAIPTLTPARNGADTDLAVVASPRITSSSSSLLAGAPDSLPALYEQLNPGVVNIQVYLEQAGISGQGAGSGFILDNEGHIITNNHVVAGAQQIAVIFFNEIEAEAEIVGTDPDSDLAVLRVERLPESTHPLALGNSAEVRVGEWVIAIGNPFGQQSSMSVGIVSAVGRTIPAGDVPFVIAEAIQTDAAINPGNSGGPLLNHFGEVIGVNAQIATGGVQANSGVGFAIPINIVRRVVPVLIEQGSYQWPWLGVQGGSVNLALMEANDLDTQQGAYLDQVIPDSPAARAGLQGSSSTEVVGGVETPVGGDVVVAADDQPVTGFSDLLVKIADKNPGDQIELTVIRDGQRAQATVELAPRPALGQTR